MSEQKVIVVGAGASGLTAAWRLQQAGFEVQILEGSDKPCGRVQSLQKNGYLMDLGADACTDGYLTYLELARELGLADQVHHLTGLVGTVVDGRVRYMNTASTLSMAMTSTYSFGTKLKMLKGLKAVAQDLEQVDYRYLYKSAHLDDPDRSAENYGLRYFGASATDYMIDPLTRIVSATGAELASILDAATGLALADSKTWTFLGGSDLLLKKLAEQINIEYQARVERVEETASGVSVHYRNATGESISTDADACVLAILYEDMLEVFPRFGEISSELSANLRYIDACKVHIGYSVPTKTRAYTIQVPTCEDEEMFLMFLDHNKTPDRAPAGHSLVNVQSDVRVAEKMAAKSDEEMVAWARNRAENLFPELAGHFDGTSNVSRWPRLGNLNYPGYYRNVAKFLDRLDESSRVQAAGDMFSKTSQEGAATRGQVVAENLIRVLAGAQTQPDVKKAS